MLTRLLSGDRPRSLVLTVILLAILGALAFAPFLFPGVRSLETAARICIFIVLVASYDLLLGYTGIVSFAHTMFFGLGAYGVALASDAMGRGWGALAVGTVAGALAAAVLAAVIGMFSLRVRAIFFAMITLAVASAVAVAELAPSRRLCLWVCPSSSTISLGSTPARRAVARSSMPEKRSMVAKRRDRAWAHADGQTATVDQLPTSRAILARQLPAQATKAHYA